LKIENLMHKTMKRIVTIGAIYLLLAVIVWPLNLKARNYERPGRGMCMFADSTDVPWKGKRAFGNHTGPGFRGERDHRCMIPDLTEDQKEKIKDIHLKAMEESKVFTDQLREQRAKHQTLVTAESPDMKAIEKSLEKMSELKLELQKIRAEKHQEIRTLLTKEQLLIFDQKGMGRAGNGKRPCCGPGRM